MVVGKPNKHIYLEFTYRRNVKKDISDDWYIEKATTYSTEEHTFDYL